MLASLWEWTAALRGQEDDSAHRLTETTRQSAQGTRDGGRYSGVAGAAPRLALAETSRGDVCMRPTVEPLPADLQRMAQAGHGFAHNLKVVIRGASRTGKTALFHRLQGKPLPPAYVPTGAIQATTVRWASRGGGGLGASVDRGRVELTKIEAWDVVDHGRAEVPGRSSNAQLRDVPDLPCLPVDSTTVNVYRDCSCVVFMLDVTRRETLNYVQSALRSVPPTVAVVIMANFMDLSAGYAPASTRPVSEADLQELLAEAPAGATQFMVALTESRPHPAFSVPPVLLHASMKTGAGLRALHNFLEAPVAMVHAHALEARLAACYATLRDAVAATQRVDDEVESKAADSYREARGSMIADTSDENAGGSSSLVASYEQAAAEMRGDAVPLRMEARYASVPTQDAPAPKAPTGSSPYAPHASPLQQVISNASMTSRMNASHEQAVTRLAEVVNADLAGNVDCERLNDFFGPEDEPEEQHADTVEPSANPQLPTGHDT
jgi:GTPase SAR1 family protein